MYLFFPAWLGSPLISGVTEPSSFEVNDLFFQVKTLLAEARYRDEFPMGLPSMQSPDVYIAKFRSFTAAYQAFSYPRRYTRQNRPTIRQSGTQGANLFSGVESPVGDGTSSVDCGASILETVQLIDRNAQLLCDHGGAQADRLRRRKWRRVEWETEAIAKLLFGIRYALAPGRLSVRTQCAVPFPVV